MATRCASKTRSATAMMPASRILHGGRPYGAPRIWRCRLDDGRQTNRSLTIRNANFIGEAQAAAGR